MSKEEVLTQDEKIHATTETIKLFIEAFKNILENDDLDRITDAISESLFNNGFPKEAAFISGLLDSLSEDKNL